MTDNPILTAEQVELIKGYHRGGPRFNDIPNICASHESLRARVAELERALEFARQVIHIAHEQAHRGLCGSATATLREYSKLLMYGSPKPNNDAEIARLAREYVAKYSEWNRDDSRVTSAIVNDLHVALIAAVEKEGKDA